MSSAPACHGGKSVLAVTRRYYAHPDAVTNAQTNGVARLLEGTAPSAPLSELSDEQLIARLNPETFAQLAALLQTIGDAKSEP